MSLIADGLADSDKRFYIVYLFTPQRLCLLGLLRMKVSDHQSVIQAIGVLVEKYSCNEIAVADMASDNAQNLKRAPASDAPIKAIQRFFNRSIFHLKSGANSSHLTAGYILQSHARIHIFRITIPICLNWL
jgi:hypothetical protein